MEYLDYIDRDTAMLIAKSAAVLLVTLALFYGLRGKIVRFAEWAHLPRLALAPVRLLLRYTVLALGLALLLALWGFPVGTLIAFFGSVIGLVAIGFVAVWSVLSNFLCTFVLVLFKPFSIGDELELPVDNVKGRVIDLSLIFTTLEVSPGETVMVPNNTFFQRVFKRRAGSQRGELADQLRNSNPVTTTAAASVVGERFYQS